MLNTEELTMNAVVESVLRATEKDPYIADGFVHMWVDDAILRIRINKIFSVDWANYVLKSFYKTRRLKNQYILRIDEANSKVFLIKVEDYKVIDIYSAGDLLCFCLDYYEVQESKESQEPSATFNDLLGVC